MSVDYSEILKQSSRLGAPRHHRVAIKAEGKLPDSVLGRGMTCLDKRTEVQEWGWFLGLELGQIDFDFITSYPDWHYTLILRKSTFYLAGLFIEIRVLS